MKNQMKETIKESVAHLNKEEAIEDLEYRVFIEKMSERMDFDFVNACEEVIKELKEL